MKRKFKAILPASEETRQITAPYDRPPLKPTTKRRPTKVACNACRLRKTACNSQRPECLECIKKGSDCVYITPTADDTPTEALKRQIEIIEAKLQDHVELITHLKSLPERRAFDLLLQLNTVSDLPMLLNSIKGSRHGKMRPSDLVAARSVSPPTQTGFEFELMAQHEVAYPALVPIDIASITLSPIVQSAIQQSHSPGRSPMDHNILESIQSPLQSGSLSAPWRETSETRGIGPPTGSPLPGPSRAGLYIDERLHNLHVSYWTNVPISDEFATSVLSFYLELDHPILGCFDADLFLIDLANHRLRFCSSFLFSSLMGYACQSYTALDIRAAALSHAFYIEAETLWYAERSTDSLTTIAAIHILSFGCVGRGKDRLGLKLMREGRLMAERLNLFGVAGNDSIKAHLSDMSSEWKKATAHTAWGFYNWLSLHALYYHDEAVAFPPCCPIPGRNEDDTAYATIRWPSHILPSYMGQTFAALCKFWTIVQEIIVVYQSPQGTTAKDHVPFAFVESKYQKLLHWADTVVLDMVQENTKPAHSIFFHILFHQMILLIFRPFLNNSKPKCLYSFASHDSTAEAVFKASLSQIKRLILFCRFERPKTLCSLFLSGAPMHICSAMLSEAVIADPEWHSWLMFCMQTYQDLYVCYPVHLDIVRGSMAMALKTGVISSSEAAGIVNTTKARGSHHKTSEEVIGLFTLDFHLALTDPEDARAHTLALKFDELAIFDEVTSGVYNEASAEF